MLPPELSIRLQVAHAVGQRERCVELDARMRLSYRNAIIFVACIIDDKTTIHSHRTSTSADVFI